MTEINDPIGTQPTNAALLNRLDLLDRQIADLQADQVKVNRPWWRDFIVLISLMTFLFSVATTIFAFTQADQQRRHERRVELRDIASRLSQLPREQFTFDSENNTGTPDQQQRRQRSLALMIQNERTVLAGQAASIVLSAPNDVTSAEYFLLAGVLRQMVDFDTAAKYYDEAAKRATNTAEYVSAMRTKAQMEFELKRVNDGRRAFDNAIARLRSDTEQTNLGSAAYTQFMWAESELAAGNCPEFKEHLSKASQNAAERKTLGLPGEQTDGYAAFLEQRRIEAKCQ